LEYGSFEGTIPKGEYGAGEVTIWDWGTYETEKWRGVGDAAGQEKGEVIAVLHGQPDGGLGGEPVKIALIKTSQNWLAHRMELPNRAVEPTKTRPKPATSAGKIKDAPKPMLASTGTVEEGYDWAFEMKWDGYRGIALCDGTDVRLVSRKGLDMTATYPKVAEALAGLDLSDTILDGELVAFGPNGAPSFHALQNNKGPVSYLVFDVLRLDGTDVTGAPYSARRHAVEELGLDGDVVRVPPAFDGALTEAVETSRELGLEGVVAKRTDSPYRVGKRSAAWVKLKHVNAQEAVIVGWRPGAGNRSGSIGSLLLAVPDDEDGDGWRYAGRVGSGFSDKTLKDLQQRLAPLARKTPPVEVVRADAKDAHWVRPALVGEVTFTEETPDGRLRHPVWKGLRPDKSPEDLRS
ncbi:MAG TPA: non-homologous end-joining DNA ligase, partial [Aeromicrobium sp.]|nr:non-homologous end-joining DNA ligase [Aeromicrobium sp.]